MTHPGGCTYRLAFSLAQPRKRPTPASVRFFARGLRLRVNEAQETRRFQFCHRG
jgi:hypothetical protein